MATTTVQKGLLGYDPMEQRLANQKLWANLYGQAQSPYERIGLALGQIGGNLFGGESPMQTKESAVNKALQTAAQGAQQGTPEYWTIVAQNLPADMADSVAYATTQAAAAQEAAQKSQMERVKFVTENPEQLATASQVPGTQVQALLARLTAANNGQPLTEAQVATLQASPAFQNLVGLSAAQTAGEVKAEGAPGTAADREILQNFIKQAGGDKLKGALAFREYQSNLKQKENTPLTAGNVKASDISTFISNVEKQLKPTENKLTKYNELRGLLDLANKGNADAWTQVERWLVTASGDNQIGAAETKRIASAGGIAERTVGGVQQFIAGTPTPEKIKKILQITDTLEGQAGSQFNKTREKLLKTWGTSELPPETLSSELGTPYVTAAEKKKRAQDTAAEATRQQSVVFTPEQTNLLKKYSLPVKK